MTTHPPPLGYIVGNFHRKGRRFANSWTEHILEVDHTYGVQRAYGKSLCGLRGSMTVSAAGIRELADINPPLGSCFACQRSRTKRVGA